VKFKFEKGSKSQAFDQLQFPIYTKPRLSFHCCWCEIT